jgi:hypothetical protein
VFMRKVPGGQMEILNGYHLEPWWGWHWRRWIRLNREGRLRGDYEDQFVSPTRSGELIRIKICTRDERVANWLKNRQHAATSLALLE